MFLPVIIFFRRLILEISEPIVAKLCHMFGGDCNFKKLVKNLGPPQQFVADKRQNFGAISDSFATLSRISPDWNKI